jgi:hypothetical protein
MDFPDSELSRRGRHSPDSQRERRSGAGRSINQERSVGVSPLRAIDEKCFTLHPIQESRFRR